MFLDFHQKSLEFEKQNTAYDGWVMYIVRLNIISTYSDTN